MPDMLQWVYGAPGRVVLSITDIADTITGETKLAAYLQDIMPNFATARMLY